MSLSSDESKPIRSGEELNIDALEAFLNEALQTDGAQKLVVEQFPSGFSNLTYLIKLGAQELVLRRPPFGYEKIAKGHDMGREYKVLHSLQPHYPKAPRPLVYTENTEVIGAPFYVMERVKGIILRARQDTGFDQATNQRFYQNFIDNLADLHNLDLNATGLADLGKTEGYLQRQVEGWIKRYKNAQTDDIPEMEEALAWFPQNIPQTSYNALIHNDYKFDNIVLDPTDPTQIKAVLDWEMTTVGDALSDLATALAYIPEEGDPAASLVNFSIKIRPGALNREELLALYQERTQREAHDMVFYYAFAIFKLGVIIQQIYFRYKKGFTQDQRFAPLIFMVKDCGKMSSLAIRSGRIRNF
ncbi:phosphotransferase family protein [Eisenibacter elegans]|jgi:aminoglycoside phosphotransferase (APT) family kinase protein|uniref:phosphotransferase family protein n=1 Tax=Eisenibacter elegans TaxID=997 RepID=UPI00041AC34E|nr:phosphotransferase family protein [Eisenibacter elegans]